MAETIRIDTSMLDDALAHVSREARHIVADQLACHFHNDGYTLEGNTEANDVEWFARVLYCRRDIPVAWDRADERTKDQYREIARGVLEVLPAFQTRVAHRLITLSKVVRDIERAERSNRKRAGSPHE